MNIKKLSIFIFTAVLLILAGCNNDNPNSKQYVVRFIGLKDTKIDTILVWDYEKINYPTAPHIEGYEFIGWDQTIEYPTGDVTIKALYEILTFTVTFYDNDDNIISTQKVEYNKSATAPTPPTINGYRFIGWDSEYSNVKNDLIIKPLYDGLSYVIKYYY